MDKFDETLLSVIDEVLLLILGANSVKIIYNYLESMSLPKHEIPSQLDKFSKELRKLLGDNTNLNLSPAYMLEVAIVKHLCGKLNLQMKSTSPIKFSVTIQEIKEHLQSET